MSDVPWMLVLGLFVSGLAMVAGVQTEKENLVYAGIGLVMGLCWGAVEALEWSKRLRQKYKLKEGREDG